VTYPVTGGVQRRERVRDMIIELGGRLRMRLYVYIKQDDKVDGLP